MAMRKQVRLWRLITRLEGALHHLDKDDLRRGVVSLGVCQQLESALRALKIRFKELTGDEYSKEWEGVTG